MRPLGDWRRWPPRHTRRRPPSPGNAAGRRAPAVGLHENRGADAAAPSGAAAAGRPERDAAGSRRRRRRRATADFAAFTAQIAPLIRAGGAAARGVAAHPSWPRRRSRPAGAARWSATICSGSRPVRRGPGAKVSAPTHEYENGQYVAIADAFRAYPSYEASVQDFVVDGEEQPALPGRAGQGRGRRRLCAGAARRAAGRPTSIMCASSRPSPAAPAPAAPFEPVRARAAEFRDRPALAVR